MRKKRLNKVRLSYQFVKVVDDDMITCSEDAYKFALKHMFSEDTLEHHIYVKAILLNRTKKVIGILDIAEGGIAECPFDNRIILQAAILSNASSVIVLMNHPSGTKDASQTTKKVSHKLKEALSLVSMQLDDLITFSKEGYYSLADNGEI